MAFFKFRKASAEPARTPAASQSIEALRQRAKYRLAGASVLVLLGVIGFPLLFDKQPRSIGVDTPIDIPDRNKVPPLALPATAAKAQPVVSAVAQAAPASPAVSLPAVSTDVLPKPKEEPASQAAAKVSTAKPAGDASAVKPGADKKVPLAQVESAKDATKSVVIESSKSVGSASPKASDPAKAAAAAEDKASAAADGGRYVVQVGAFAEADRAREVRTKLEKAGMKTYTHVAETKDGKRIRVRVGPFASKPEAKKAAEKIKQLNLPAAVLTL
jgi:DedD protein